MVITLLLSMSFSVLIVLLILHFILPAKVQYIEGITIAAPVSKVYDAIRFQELLMQWSAWPRETKSQCAVKNMDGQIGAQTVYLQKGKQFGYQEVTHLIANAQVGFYLTSKAPFEQDTRMHFYLRALDDDATEVSLYFDNTLKKPSHIIPHVFGIITWTYQMHLKDLAGLKEFLEPTR